MSNLKSTISTNQELNNDVVNKQQNNNFDSYMTLYNKTVHNNVFNKCYFTVLDENKKKVIHQIVFLMDATGSMQTYINGTKLQIKTFIDNLRSKVYDDFENEYNEQERKEFEFIYEVAIVCYRDFGDNIHFETLDFTNDLSKVEQFLGTIRANGGSDAPEDVKGAFIHALFGIDSTNCKLSWEDRGQVASRNIMWLADAPPHGNKFNCIIDNYKQDENGWETLIDEMVRLDTDLTLVKLCNDTTMANTEFKNLCQGKMIVEEIDVSQSVKNGFEKNSSEAYECIEKSTSSKTINKTRTYLEKIKSEST